MIKTKIVGILNITPDSFSDGGKFFKTDDAVKAIRQFIQDGADIIDIGAESTRPGAVPLTHDEEWQRLEPVLKALPRAAKVQFSLDTRHADTARKALTYGLHWINDVSGFGDTAMIDAVKSSACKLVLMHSLSVPADKNMVMPTSSDVVQELMAFAEDRIAVLEKSGIARERIIFDPGIGFGKTAGQSLEIIHEIERFFTLDVPILVGHSRKSFLGKSVAMRDDATLKISEELARRGVSYLRVHDVPGHVHMLELLKESYHGE